jgi:CRISPR/Cas system CSM-associated protein Csm3 (group 7 of RAMP superfamily)
MEMVFNVFEAGDRRRFLDVVTAMQLVEDDYLGGQGSRGSGKIAFEKVAISVRKRNDYGVETTWAVETTTPNTVPAILAPEARTALQSWLQAEVPIEDYQPPKA